MNGPEIFLLIMSSLKIISLLCMTGYAILAHYSPDRLVLMQHDQNTNRSLAQKSFLVLAAGGFLFCVYAGVENSLLWFPSDESWSNLRDFFALLFTLTVGGVLIGRVSDYQEKVFELELASRRATGLHRLAEARNVSALTLARSSLKEDQEGVAKGQVRLSGGDLFDPIDRRIWVYQDLIRLADLLISDLGSRREENIL